MIFRSEYWFRNIISHTHIRETYCEKKSEEKSQMTGVIIIISQWLMLKCRMCCGYGGKSHEKFMQSLLFFVYPLNCKCQSSSYQNWCVCHEWTDPEKARRLFSFVIHNFPLFVSPIHSSARNNFKAITIYLRLNGISKFLLVDDGISLKFFVIGVVVHAIWSVQTKMLKFPMERTRTQIICGLIWMLRIEFSR